jgi:hypothetical protein
MNVNQVNVARNRRHSYQPIDQDDLERTRDEEQEEREKQKQLKDLANKTNIYKSRVIGKFLPLI